MEEKLPLNPLAHSKYRAMICTLIQLATCTLPHLAFAFYSLRAPSTPRQALAKRILRYLAGTIDQGLSYTNDKRFDGSSLSTHLDADWGGVL